MFKFFSFLFLFLLILMTSCQDENLDYETREKSDENITLYQKGAPRLKINVKWNTLQEYQRPVSNYRSFYRNGLGELYPEHTKFYANRIHEKRRFYVPDRVLSFDFLIRDDLKLRQNDELTFVDGFYNATTLQGYIGDDGNFTYNYYHNHHTNKPSEMYYIINFIQNYNNNGVFSGLVEFETDAEGGDSGWNDMVANMAYDPNSNIQRNYNYPIKLNRGYDILLMEGGDRINFKVNIDSSERNIVHLLHLTHRDINDFDIYVKGGSGGSPQIATASNSDFSGVKGTWTDNAGRKVSLNELISIPAGYFGSGVDTLYITVESYNGKGHAKLLINQTTSKTLTVGLKEPNGTLPVDPTFLESIMEDERFEVFQKMSRLLYEATDGQILIDKFVVDMDGCPGYCDLYIVPPRLAGRNGRRNAFHMSVETKGEFEDDNGNMVEYDFDAEKIGRIFAHEYGHELGLPDQYGGSEDDPLSGHSIMIGSDWANRANIRDFSVRHNHGYNPITYEDGTAYALSLVGDDANWEELDNDHSYLYELPTMQNGLDPDYQQYEDRLECEPMHNGGLQDIYFDQLIYVEIKDSTVQSPLNDGLFAYRDKCGGLEQIN